MVRKKESEVRLSARLGMLTPRLQFRSRRRLKQGIRTSAREALFNVSISASKFYCAIILIVDRHSYVACFCLRLATSQRPVFVFQARCRALRP